MCGAADMTWTKQSDDFADDCWGLSDAAFRLHSEGLIWSNRKLLDCRIPKEDLRRFKRPEAVTELLETGWWAEEGEVYVIRHHAGYQRRREDVLAQQAANLANGRRGGRPRKHRETEPVTDSPTQSETQSVSETQAVSESRTQSPTETETERDRDLFGDLPTEGSSSVGGSGGKTRRRPRRPIPDDWAPTDLHRAYATEHGLDLEHEAEQFRSRNQAQDQRYADWNSAFRTWLGNAVQFRTERRSKLSAVPGGYTRDSHGRRTEVS